MKAKTDVRQIIRFYEPSFPPFFLHHFLSYLALLYIGVGCLHTFEEQIDVRVTSEYLSNFSDSFLLR